MATSGVVNGDLGSLSDRASIRWELDSQNIAGNYSLVNWEVRWLFPAFTCRGLRQGQAHVNGVMVYNDQDPGDGVHQFNSGHNHQTLVLASGQIQVPHNADGTKTFQVSVAIRGWEGGGPNFLSDGETVFSLPTIPRNPKAPTTPSISEVTQTSVKLTWAANSADVLPNTNYIVSYGTSTNATGFTTTTPITGTVKTITGLSPGTKYYFKVKAVNVAGEGPYSSIANATTISGPTNVPTISEVEQTSLKLSWTKPSGNAPITSYTISYGTATNAVGSLTTSTTTSKVITGLSPGIRYYFKVKAHNATGESPYSGIVNALTIAGAYVRHSGTYKRAVPFVRHAGVWKRAQPYAKILGVWKKSTN